MEAFMSEKLNLPATGFVRLAAILGPRGPIPVSKSTWWAGIRTGRFPSPLKLGPRITVWRVEDIRTLIATGAPAGGPSERLK
jgi:prophage regulatory protein